MVAWAAVDNTVRFIRAYSPGLIYTQFKKIKWETMHFTLLEIFHPSVWIR